MLIIGTEIWEVLPMKVKGLDSLNFFEKVIKKEWKTESCPCRVCKPFIRRVGHIS